MNVQTPADIVALLAIASAVLGGLMYLIKAQNAISREFKRNGGSSAKDALYRIERDLVAMRERLDQHIDNHHRGSHD